MTEERRKGDRRIPPAVAQLAIEERGELLARIEELEAHCVRLGQGDAERYWEGRWRDADAQIGDLVAHIERQDDDYALLSLDAGRKMEGLERENAALKNLLDRAHGRMDELKAQPSAGVLDERIDSGSSFSLDALESLMDDSERTLQSLHMAELMTGHKDRSGDCFKALGEILYDNGYRLNPCRAQYVPDGYVMVKRESVDYLADQWPGAYQKFYAIDKDHDDE